MQLWEMLPITIRFRGYLYLLFSEEEEEEIYHLDVKTDEDEYEDQDMKDDELDSESGGESFDDEQEINTEFMASDLEDDGWEDTFFQAKLLKYSEVCSSRNGSTLNY